MPETPRPPRPFRRAAAVVAATALSGCVLDWEKPGASVEVPEAFRAAKPEPAEPAPSGAQWAAQFRSPELTRIVEEALEQNLDIAAAVARIAQADAQARLASAPLWPVLNLNVIQRRTQTPGAIIASQSTAGSTSGGVTTPKPRIVNFSQYALNASYEIDFWGKNESASNAARLLANASRFDHDVVEIATIATAANSYFQILTAQDRLRIARANVRIAESVLAAIKARLDAGVATALDYSQQETVVATQRATIPPLEQTLQQTKNTLAVLLGVAPEGFNVAGGSLTRLRFPAIKPGLPSELVLRRPDVAKAEADLVSQEFSVKQARAAFFPSIQFTGMYGVQSVAYKTLFRPEAIAWQVAGNLTQPLFDGYNLQGQYMLQKGKYAELAQTYRKQILTAFSDVENALTAVAETKRQLKLQGQAAAAARRAYAAADARLREGIIDIVTMATVETTLFQNVDALAQARLAYFQAAASLFQALGGGWNEFIRATEEEAETVAYEADKGPWP